MGERGNIIVKQSEGQIVFYTHWRGYETDKIVASALRRKLRWSDEAYLSRIIFCELVKGEEDGETGYGICLSPPDENYPPTVVDCVNQTVNGVPFENFVKAQELLNVESGGEQHGT